MTRPELVCARCRRTPAQLGYGLFTEEGQSPDDYVWDMEGTLDRATGRFLCDGCYLAVGLPAFPGPTHRWTATDVNVAALRLVHPEIPDPEEHT